MAFGDLFSSLSTASLTDWLSIATAAAVAIVGSRCIYLLYEHPLHNFPGPKICAVSHIFVVYHWMKGKYPWAIEQLHKKYGPVVRVAPNELAFSTPQAGKDIYLPAVNHHEKWVKTDLMDFGAGDLGFVWENDPAKRREVARKIMPAFSSKATKAKEPTVVKYIDLFVEKLKQRGDVPEGINLDQWINWLAMDMAADLAYSREMHHLRDEKDSDFMVTMLGTSFYGTVMQMSKKIPILKPFAIFFVPLKVIRLIPKFFKMNRDEVQARVEKRGKTTHPDFVDFMLPADAPPPQTEKERVHLEQVAMQMFVTGFDPIQLIYYGNLFWLKKNPEAYATIVEEVRGAFETYDDITVSSTVGLQYLHACLQETLRVFSVVATGMPRLSPGAEVDGHYIRKGIVCQVSLFTIARSEEHFHDALNYHPERWLSPDHPKYDAKFANDNLKAYFPFGLGPRACIGREIAWSQARLFLAKVLWTFDVEVTRGHDKTFDADFSYHVMWNKPEVYMRFTQR